MSEIKKTFGSAIRKRRVEKNLTQEKLAERSGLHRTYIGDIERGERNVSLENIQKLLESLEISFSEFFSEYIQVE